MSDCIRKQRIFSLVMQHHKHVTVYVDCDIRAGTELRGTLQMFFFCQDFKFCVNEERSNYLNESR
jgi:hypothetical protein